MPWRGDHAYEVVREALTKAKRLARRLVRVLGVDYGVVHVEGEPIDELGIRFHVPKKIAASALRVAELLPNRLESIRCDVLVASYRLHADEDPRTKLRPLRPGSSVGNVTHRKAGTLGCFVRTRADRRVAFLSNWHVLFGGADARVGDEVSQPSVKFATGPAADVVGRLHRQAGLDRGYDAATALVESGVDLNPRILGADVQPVDIIDVEPRMRLVKFGVTSGLTHGAVDGILGSYEMNYEPYGDAKRWMEGFRIVPDTEVEAPETEISLGGDSGAIWVEHDTGRAVGLHFAGEDGLGPSGEYALAHPIRPVIDLLEVDPFV